jgi:PadR family transcriptional regulator PadR
MKQVPNISDTEADLIGIVLALNGADEEAYGVPINAELTRIRGGREIVSGALYTSLQRLVNKGLLEAESAAGTPERGNRSKRLYKVTGTGIRAFRKWEAERLRLLDTVRPAWGRS